MYYMPFFYDPYFWMIILGVAISGWASMNVNSTFNRYDQVRNQGNYTGKAAARYILDQAGLYEVEIRALQRQLRQLKRNYRLIVKDLELYWWDCSYQSTCRQLHEFLLRIDQLDQEYNGQRLYQYSFLDFELDHND